MACFCYKKIMYLLDESSENHTAGLGITATYQGKWELHVIDNPHLPWWALLCEWQLFYYICNCICSVSKCKNQVCLEPLGEEVSESWVSPNFPQHSSGSTGRTLICWVPWTEVRFLSWPHPRLLEDSNTCYNIHHTFGLGLTCGEQEVRWGLWYCWSKLCQQKWRYHIAYDQWIVDIMFHQLHITPAHLLASERCRKLFSS